MHFKSGRYAKIEVCVSRPLEVLCPLSWTLAYMTLRSDLSDALKDAMRSKDEAGVSTLRMILAGLKDRDIAARTKGTDRKSTRLNSSH